MKKVEESKYFYVDYCHLGLRAKKIFSKISVLIILFLECELQITLGVTYESIDLTLLYLSRYEWLYILLWCYAMLRKNNYAQVYLFATTHNAATVIATQRRIVYCYKTGASRTGRSLLVLLLSIYNNVVIYWIKFVSISVVSKSSLVEIKTC